MPEEFHTYDRAQICANGHVISDRLRAFAGEAFCSTCGEATMKACTQCHESIRGRGYWVKRYFSRTIEGPTDPAYGKPNFCHACGAPFPWTKRSLAAAQELAAAIKGLAPAEREDLSRSLDQILRDTPATRPAALRIRGFLGKAGGVAASALKDVIVQIATQAAKEVLFPGQGKG